MGPMIRQNTYIGCLLPIILALAACQQQTRTLTPEEQRYRDVQAYCKSYASIEAEKSQSQLEAAGYSGFSLGHKMHEVRKTYYSGCMLDRGLRP